MPERILLSQEPSTDPNTMTARTLERPSDFLRGLPTGDLEFLTRRVLDELARRGIGRFDGLRTDWRDAFREHARRAVDDLNRQSYTQRWGGIVSPDALPADAFNIVFSDDAMLHTPLQEESRDDLPF